MRKIIQHPLFTCLLFALLIILISILGFAGLPFLDHTESRVAIIAKDMIESGNLFKLELPVNGVRSAYWSKPPFHYWLVACAMKLCGFSEMVARIPSLLWMFISLLTTAAIANRLWGKREAINSLLLLSSLVLFFATMNTALIDSTLTGALTLSLAFAVFMLTENGLAQKKLHAALLGFFLGIGLIAKGPIALALPAVSAAIWVIMFSKWDLALKIPWFYMLSALSLIAIPFYALVELKNPGFLRYFLLDENIMRFISSDFSPHSGSGHKQIYGSTWLFLLVGLLPWTPLFIICFKDWLKSKSYLLPDQQYIGLILVWGLAPAFFFTFARHHLATYLVPGFPALALFVSHQISLEGGSYLGFLKRMSRILQPLLLIITLSFLLISFEYENSFSARLISILSSLFLLFSPLIRAGWIKLTDFQFIAATALLSLLGIFSASSHITDDYFSSRDILADVAGVTAETNAKLVFPVEIPYSAYIYSNVWPARIDVNQALALRKNGENVVFVLRDKHLPALKEQLKNCQQVLHDGKWLVFVSR